MDMQHARPGSSLGTGAGGQAWLCASLDGSRAGRFITLIIAAENDARRLQILRTAWGLSRTVMLLVQRDKQGGGGAEMKRLTITICDASETFDVSVSSDDEEHHLLWWATRDWCAPHPSVPMSEAWELKEPRCAQTCVSHTAEHNARAWHKLCLEHTPSPWEPNRKMCQTLV
jgi:hypothetical protein